MCMARRYRYPLSGRNRVHLHGRLLADTGRRRIRNLAHGDELVLETAHRRCGPPTLLYGQLVAPFDFFHVVVDVAEGQIRMRARGSSATASS